MAARATTDTGNAAMPTRTAARAVVLPSPAAVAVAIAAAPTRVLLERNGIGICRWSRRRGTANRCHWCDGNYPCNCSDYRQWFHEG